MIASLADTVAKLGRLIKYKKYFIFLETLQSIWASAYLVQILIFFLTEGEFTQNILLGVIRATFEQSLFFSN